MNVGQRYNSYRDNVSEDIMNLLKDDDIVELEYYVRHRGRRVCRKYIAYKLSEHVIFKNTEGVGTFTYYIKEHRWMDKGHNPKIKRILTNEEYKRRLFEVM